MENQQQQQQTGLCRSGCGFYGSAVTEGLCSKCFKDNLKRTQDTSTPRINQNSSVASKLTIPSNVESASTSMDVSIGISTNSLISRADTPSSANINILDKAILDQKLTEDIVSTELLVTARDSLVSLNAPSSSISEEIVSSEISNSTKKPNRCHTCKKRVGLTGFVCRCGGMYCGEHRYDKAHNCSFDYKTMEREEIRKNNPVVVSDKIQRI